MVYMGSPYIFYIFMIKCGWLGNVLALVLLFCVWYTPYTEGFGDGAGG